jgi:hypothetical protein
LVLGLIDGISNALSLAAGGLFGGSAEFTVGLSLRIGAAAFATAAFAVARCELDRAATSARSHGSWWPRLSF